MGKKKGRRLARPSAVRRWCIERLESRGAKSDGRSWWQYTDAEIAYEMRLTDYDAPQKLAQEMLDKAFILAGEPDRRKALRIKLPPVKQLWGADSSSFLLTYEWRRLRMEALKKYGAKCMCCGATPATGAVINVDHIKPRRLFPQLALDIDNLQVLCAECNHGKGNWDMTDWRGEHVASGEQPTAGRSQADMGVVLESVPAKGGKKGRGEGMVADEGSGEV